MSESHSGVFPGQFDSLPKIIEFVTRVAESAGLTTQDVYAVQLAVDEACSNIIEHAYGGEGQGDIRCVCDSTEQGLTIRLYDHGHPFDPALVPEPDLYSTLEERQEGGLGLYIIKQLMDEVHFHFQSEAGTTLTLVKLRNSAG